MVKREMVKPDPKHAVIYDLALYLDGPLGHEAAHILIQILKSLGRSTRWRACEWWRDFYVQRDNLSKNPFTDMIKWEGVGKHLFQKRCLGAALIGN